MFAESENLQVIVHSLTFRAKDAREKDPTKIAEITFEAPLDYDLAADVNDEMASDLFTSRGKPKNDLAEASYLVKSAQYLMGVRLTPAGRMQKLAGCTVRDLRAYRTSGAERGWLLGFKVSFLMTNTDEVVPFLKHFRQSVFLTFEEQEPVMDLDGGEPAGEGSVADVDSRGNVERIRPAKKKKADKAETKH